MPAKAEEVVFSAEIKVIEMSDIELITLIERYLNGELTADERVRFELLRRDNAAVDSEVKQHQEFTARLKQYGERLEFEKRLNSIHDEIDVQALKDEFIPHPSFMVKLWRNHHSKISVAATIAIFCVLGTLFFTGYIKTQNQEETVTNLSRAVTQVRHLNEVNSQSINQIKHAIKIAPPNYGGAGTGFAISDDGYVVTNYHVIKDADSVYVQNAGGDAYHAKIISTDPLHDLAVLKINDSSFKSLGALPYSFRRSKSDLGEDVFTIGYPKDDAVYNKGYVSSDNGLKNDTLVYQVTMDVNPGNSGGPLLDARGNVIGVLSSKHDGSAFVIKSKYLFKSLQNIPADSLGSDKFDLSGKNTIANLSRPQQIKKLQNYIFMVKVYNK